MRYFNFVGDSNNINVIINDEDKLNDRILKIMNDIGGEYKEYTPSDNSDLYIAILQRLLLKELKDNIVMLDNIPYIIHLPLRDNSLNLVASKIQHDKIENGYTIALTLQTN